MSTGKLRQEENGEYAHHFNSSDHEFKKLDRGRLAVFSLLRFLMFGGLVCWFLYLLPTFIPTFLNWDQ
jgi:predicted MFS family arabinose efflux permease